MGYIKQIFTETVSRTVAERVLEKDTPVKDRQDLISCLMESDHIPQHHKESSFRQVLFVDFGQRLLWPLSQE